MASCSRRLGPENNSPTAFVHVIDASNLSTVTTLRVLLSLIGDLVVLHMAGQLTNAPGCSWLRSPRAHRAGATLPRRSLPRTPYRPICPRAVLRGKGYTRADHIFVRHVHITFLRVVFLLRSSLSRTPHAMRSHPRTYIIPHSLDSRH
jgi:hypothetical protein